MEKRLEKELEINMASCSIMRLLPKEWKNDVIHKKDGVDVIHELADYCMLLYSNLHCIKQDYKKEFNADNTYTIDDYIAIFNSAYEKIFSELVIFSPKLYRQKVRNEDLAFLMKGRFSMLREDVFLSKKALKGYLSSTMSFNEDTYKKLLPQVKKIFMVEKLCSFTTRIFWKNELTPIEKLDLSKPFKILAKVIFPYGWRGEKITPELKNYYNKRIYASASLIDQDHMNKLFNYGDNSNVAVLILQSDDDIVCASNYDSYSEEMIDGINQFANKTTYSDIFLQDVDFVDGSEHKMYAEATEIATPKSILKGSSLYSEVNLKNAKIVGVLVPNEYSFEFSKEASKRYNVPLFVPKDMKPHKERSVFYDKLEEEDTHKIYEPLDYENWSNNK